MFAGGLPECCRAVLVCTVPLIDYSSGVPVLVESIGRVLVLAWRLS